MASPIATTWVHATVRLENEWGKGGTGFLVSRQDSPTSGKIFLVTNKHVVHQDPALRAQAKALECHFNAKGSTPGSVSVAVPLQGPGRRHEHPDPDTDVLAVNISDIIEAASDLEAKWVPYGDLADTAKIDELEITVAEEVVVVGYPLRLRQGKSNLPLVRQGILATSPGHVLYDEVPGTTGPRARTLKAFLIDGAMIPGSSGSPVVLKPILGRLINGSIMLSMAPSVLLGIVAETKYAPLNSSLGVIPGFAGLGLAFDASTIKETIDHFPA